MTTTLDEALQRLVAEQEERDRPVVEHPLFQKLVKEVAVADQPDHPGYYRARMNSETYGSWMVRGMKDPRRGDRGHSWKTRRAWLFAGMIAKDLGLCAGAPEGEGAAVAFVVARDRVKGRVLR